jgi:hypothetical protein
MRLQQQGLFDHVSHFADTHAFESRLNEIGVEESCLRLGHGQSVCTSKLRHVSSPLIERGFRLRLENFWHSITLL